jgi:hypothetical protein
MDQKNIMSSEKKHFVALTCEALARSVYAAAATSPHTVTVRLFQQGLHNTPKRLQEMLQKEIDEIQDTQYDAILLAYGLCGLATHGIKTTKLPLVIPRAHDCITLYLGSRKRYQEEFTAYPGTYWYSLDYLQRNEVDNMVALGASTQATLDAAYEEYIKKYGKENADYLMKVMGSWQTHYTRAVYIQMHSGEDDTFERQAQEAASQHGWTFQRLHGDRHLLNQLIRGEWPEEDFLVLPPGNTIIQSMDPELIIQAERILDFE